MNYIKVMPDGSSRPVSGEATRIMLKHAEPDAVFIPRLTPRFLIPFAVHIQRLVDRRSAG